MQTSSIFHVSSLSELQSLGVCRVAVALGVFDGVHIGHQQILHRLVNIARETDAVPVALTFSPHPRSVLTDWEPRLLCSEEKRREWLCHFGASHTVTLNFTPEFGTLAPVEFLNQTLLVPGLTLTAVVVGEHWRFGCSAAGDTALLKSYANDHGFQLVPVPEVVENKEIVSSSRIRHAVTEGDLDLAHTLLNRPYSLRGVIGNGFGIASLELETPTANLLPETHVLPPNGVYAAFAVWKGTLYPAIVSIGLSPTFNYGLLEPRIEVHLIGAEVRLMGETLEIFFIRFLRDEICFEDIDDLKMQISQDILSASEELENTPVSEIPFFSTLAVFPPLFQ